jgi:hypothetical protein
MATAVSSAKAVDRANAGVAAARQPLQLQPVLLPVLSLSLQLALPTTGGTSSAAATHAATASSLTQQQRARQHEGVEHNSILLVAGLGASSSQAFIYDR